MSIRVLLVEDDDHICSIMGMFLAETGYQVDACIDGGEAYTKSYENTYQLVVPDIMLPGMDGHELLRKFRTKNDTPILMMAALQDGENRVRIFDVETNDYAMEPSEIQILLRWVEALLRYGGTLTKEIRVDRLTLLPEDFTVLCDGTELPLIRKEFGILLLLTQNKGRALTRGIILSRIWGYDFEGDGSIVHTHIKNLQTKLPESIIKTTCGIGYRLEESQ